MRRGKTLPCSASVTGCDLLSCRWPVNRNTMKEAEVRRLLAANLLCVFSVILSAVVPASFWDGFTVFGTHLAWLCICSVCVSTLNIILHLVLKPNLAPKRSSFAHKVRLLFLNCCQAVWKGSEFFH